MGQYVTSESGCHLGSTSSDGRELGVGAMTFEDGPDTTLVAGAGLAVDMLIAGNPAAPLSLGVRMDRGGSLLGRGV